MRFKDTFTGAMKKAAVACIALTLPGAAMAAPESNAQQNFEPAPGAETQPERQDWDYNKEIRRFIIKFNRLQGQTDETNLKLLNEIVQQHGEHTVTKVRDGQKMPNPAIPGDPGITWVVQVDPPIPADQALSFRADLEKKAEIAWADPDYMLVPFMTPNDTNYQYQWHLKNNGYNGYPEKSVKAESAWDLGYLGKDVNIAVVDSGITRHPDLDSKVKPGFDMIDDDFVARDFETSTWGRNGQRDDNPSDTGDYLTANYCGNGNPAQPSAWHGTHVAGIAAAVTNNRVGVAGMAPEANIVPVRVLGACGGYESDIADGMVWAAGGTVPNTPSNTNPARVVNLSLGGEGRCSNYYQQSVNKARREGAVLLVAAGNDNRSVDDIQPANCDGVVLVGASGPMGEKSGFSNWGNKVDVAAPGGNRVELNDYAAGILSTINLGQTGPGRADYGYMDGTSMATPIVSGIVAMMIEANPNLTADRIEEILKTTAQPFGIAPRLPIGTGIVDARAAVCQAILDTGATDCEKPQSTTAPVAATVTTTPAPVTQTTQVVSTPPTATATATATTTETLSGTTTVTETQKETSTSVETVTAKPTTVLETSTQTAPVATITEPVEVTETAPTPRVTETKTTTVTPDPVTVTPVPVTSTVEVTAPKETSTEVVTTTTFKTLTPSTVTEEASPATETDVVTTTAPTPVVTLAPATVTETPAPVTTTEKNKVTATETAGQETVTTTVDKRTTVTSTVKETAVVESTTTTFAPAPTVTSTQTTTVAPVTTTVKSDSQRPGQISDGSSRNGSSTDGARWWDIRNWFKQGDSDNSSVPGTSSAGGLVWIAITAGLAGVVAILGHLISQHPEVQNLIGRLR